MAIAVLVVFPLMGRGWLLVLDWVHGPHTGLPHGAGVDLAGQLSLPSMAVLDLAGWVIGSATMSWLTVAVALAFSAYAMVQLVPGGAVAKVTAAILYEVNPFVFERLGAGQVYVLLGYAVLPLVARSILAGNDASGWRRWTPAAWIAVDGALSIHFLWINGVILVAVVGWDHRLAALSWAMGIVGAVAAMDAYLIVPSLLQHPTVAVGSTDLAAYQTQGDVHLGLYLNVAGLYGFWRSGPVLPKAHVSGWAILLAAILMVAARGAWFAWRRAGQRPLVAVLGIAAILGYFLALGDQGPTGSIFRLLFDHVPGFAVMREPEKFSALVALCYAVTFGIGVESLVPRRTTRARAVTVLVAIGVVVAYTPTLFGGLDGQLKVSRYPGAWAAADKVMGSGPGSILFLPLHDYIGFGFSGGQVIANPGPVLFRRMVLVGGEVEAGPLLSDSTSPEDTYLAYIVDHGADIHDLGHLLAQLGVRYVVVANAADVASYGWVAHQRDLVRVYASPQLVVYRNPSALPEGARLTSALTVPSLACYVELAQNTDLTGVAATLDPRAPCGLTAGDTPPAPLSDVRRISSIKYRVQAGPPGTVLLPEAADSDWSMDGIGGRPLVDGIVGVDASARAGTVVYRWWWASVVADVVSAVAVLIVVVGWAVSRRRRLSTGRGPPAAEDEQRHPEIH